MDRNKDTAIEAVLEQLIDHEPGEMASVERLARQLWRFAVMRVQARDKAIR